MSASVSEEHVLSLFIEERTLSFSDIKKALGLPGEQTALLLASLIQQRKVTHTRDGYTLAKDLLLDTNSVGTKIKLFLTNNTNVLLQRRATSPYKRQWELPTTNLTLHETIETTATKHLQRITGLQADFIGISCVVHEKLLEKTARKHANINLVCMLKLSGKPHVLPFGLDWFSPEECTQNLVAPTDLWIIQHTKGEKATVHELFITEENETLLHQTSTPREEINQ
ncbi:NUDIX hydrolase [Candidatus Woesearchaeota archaeon]|nr:MAG: NUDIX hydrolase [Candidatus Woesearchaeota archaeon]